MLNIVCADVWPVEVLPAHVTKENYMNKDKEKEKPTEQEDRPEEGKVYALTGGRGTRCIANGNTWKDSEVKDA